jgi:hypothetical protein
MQKVSRDADAGIAPQAPALATGGTRCRVSDRAVVMGRSLRRSIPWPVGPAAAFVWSTG